MTKKLCLENETGLHTPICHCETAQTKNNPANCFCAQSNETQKAKRQCGRIDVGIGATKQSGEIASHSFAMTEQVGRSMVEMLGVLAVMGVLSVAGITGYNNAMNRHRANELLNEVQKRAVVVAAQAAQGRESLSISEFTHLSGYLFDVKNWNTTQFALTLTKDDGANIDAKICGLLKNRVGQNSPIREIRQNCTHFIFNKDLSAVSVGNTTCSNDSDCDGCQKCQNGFCVDKCAENQVCALGSSLSDYVCKEIPLKCSECKKDEWCNIEGISSHPRSCVTGTIATCDPIENPDVFNKRKITIESAIGKTITLYKGELMTWWSAKNFCEAHGKKMVSAETLGLKNILCPSKPEECQTVDGNPIPDSFWSEVYGKLPGYSWLTESKDSCQAYAIRTHSQDITAWYRLFKNYSALCE